MQGWKKEISYAFGIAHDHVQDVTFRYVFDHRALRKRRRQCREPVLLNCITVGPGQVGLKYARGAN